MEEKGLTDILSNLIPDADEKNPKPQVNQSNEQDQALAEGLETLAGRSGGEIKTAINDFLQGKGELHESTRSALAVDKKSAEKKIVELLSTRFNLSPVLAAAIAPMLVKLLPSAGTKNRKTTSTKRKTGTTKKKKTSTTKKKTTVAKKPKKKTATTKKPKKKTSTTKNKKTAASSTKKKTGTTMKPK